jgi:AcrR family transcriptional regulator
MTSLGLAEEVGRSETEQPLLDMKNTIGLSTTPVGDSPVRSQILNSACYVFSEFGFGGTHLHEVCAHAGVNAAALFCYFQSKEELYLAVAGEAGRQLASSAERASHKLPNSPPEEKLRGLVESLFEVLGGEGAWIGKLLTHELAAPLAGVAGSVAAGLGIFAVMLNAVINEIHGPRTNPETPCLATLSIISECVFYCVAQNNFQRNFSQMIDPLPDRKTLARHVSGAALWALRGSNPKGE